MSNNNMEEPMGRISEMLDRNYVEMCGSTLKASVRYADAPAAVREYFEAEERGYAEQHEQRVRSEERRRDAALKLEIACLVAGPLAAQAGSTNVAEDAFTIADNLYEEFKRRTQE